MATYKQVLEVLGRFYSADEEAISGVLRARVQNFQRLGVPLGMQIGKGKRIDYGRNELYQLVFCLELSELGMTPANISDLVSRYWQEFYWKFFQLALGGDNISIYFKLTSMSDAWRKTEEKEEDRFGFSHLVIQAGVGKNKVASPSNLRHFSGLNISLIVKDVESLLIGYPPAGMTRA